MLEQCMEMYRVIHGPYNPHPDLAMSFDDLVLLYLDMGELEGALDMCEQGLEMHRAIYGSDKPNHSNFTAISLWTIGSVYQKQKIEPSLAMLRIVHGQNSLRPDITTVQRELADVYESLGRREEVLGVRESNTKTDGRKRLYVVD